MTPENLAILSDLIQVAKADNKITESEYDFILEISSLMEVDKEELDALFENPLPSLVQSTELERITHFYKMILLMNVDHETHKDEINVIRNFSLKMGIRPGVMDQILFKMEQFENKILPSDEIMKIFKTYYN